MQPVILHMNTFLKTILKGLGVESLNYCFVITWEIWGLSFFSS